jgi:hypothetical protein
MQIDAEESLLHGVERIVDSEALPFSSETIEKLDYFRPVDQEDAIWSQRELVSLISLVENNLKWDEISERIGTKSTFQVCSLLVTVCIFLIKFYMY